VAELCVLPSQEDHLSLGGVAEVEGTIVKPALLVGRVVIQARCYSSCTSGGGPVAVRAGAGPTVGRPPGWLAGRLPVG